MMKVILLSGGEERNALQLYYLLQGGSWMRLKKMLSALGFALMLGAFGAAAVPLAEGVQVVQAAEQVNLPVTMSRGSGVYAEGFSLTLNSPGASAIYYTLDGSNPVSSKTRVQYVEALSVTDRSSDPNYVTAVDPVKFDTGFAVWNSETETFGDSMKAPADSEVDKGTVVRAVAADAAGNYGAVSTNTYFVGVMAEHIRGIDESASAAGIPLSVISISVDYDDLFDYEKGIYVRGKIFDESLKAYIEEHGTRKVKDKARNIAANYSQKGRDWERNAHIDYFETNGEVTECKLQQDCGIRIQGNYSRSDLMKGLRLYARAEYGDKNFRYPFFADAKDEKGNVIDKHKKLVLRNGGNYAFSGTKYNDAYWQSMLKDLACETQSSRACVVYIDGEYWGLYLLQQDYDSDYFEETHGVNKDSVVVYKASDAEADEAYGYKLDEGDLPAGVTDTNYFYQDLLKFFETHQHLVNKSDYDAFAKLVDPQSVMDYFAVNVWVNNKWDWPDKNWSMWRTSMIDPGNKYADGRWRFCFYDLDFGGCNGSGDAKVNTIKDGNYETDGKGLLGQNKTRPMNPALQCFILLMSNQGFREDFKKELAGFANGIFEKDMAHERLWQFRETYEPLFRQYYARYFGPEEEDRWYYGTETGYASYQSLRDFVDRRGGYISNINDYLDEYYKNLGLPDPDVPGNDGNTGNTGNTGGSQNTGNTTKPAKKAIKKLSVTAKKGKKVIQVKTIAKAKVTASLNKKIALKGKKKVKKITVTASKKGIVKIKLSKKLARGVKVKVQVKKSGYKTKSKTVKVK